jgi:hypothetical protein
MISSLSKRRYKSNRRIKSTKRQKQENNEKSFKYWLTKHNEKTQKKTLPNESDIE